MGLRGAGEDGMERGRMAGSRGGLPEAGEGFGERRRTAGSKGALGEKEGRDAGKACRVGLDCNPRTDGRTRPGVFAPKDI